MRIFKFRAWDKISDEMIDHDNLMLQRYGHHPDNIFNDDSHIVMQYIGIDDKNGKEIYEGDVIVSKLLGYSGVPIHEDYTSLIHFYHSIVEYDAKACDLEVIGSIYEDTELLKGLL